MFSLRVESLGTGQLAGAATQLVEDDQRIEDVLLHKQQPHVELLKPHHMGRIWRDGQGQLTSV